MPSDKWDEYSSKEMNREINEFSSLDMNGEIVSGSKQEQARGTESEQADNDRLEEQMLIRNQVKGADRDDEKEYEGSFAFRGVTSLLLFGLLAEWLLPWGNSGQLSLIFQPIPLMMVIGLILLTGIFRLSLGVTIPLNIVIVLAGLMLLFKSDNQSVLDWLIAFPVLLTEQVQLIIQNGLWAMSDEIRTLLLFVGWSLLAPALQSLIWLRQTALSIAAITLLYLVTLHIWLGMDVMSGLLRTTAEGLLLAAVVALPRVRRMMDVGVGRLQGVDRSWLAGSLFLTLIIVGFSLLASGEKETDLAPAAWTVAMTERLQQGIDAINSDGASVAALRNSKAGQLGKGLTGYGFDDTKLGASLSDDSTVVFNGYSSIRANWRGESKSFYDGSGWSNDVSELTLLPVQTSSTSVRETGVTSEGNSGFAGGPPKRKVHLLNKQ